jgi:hypothetical protein
MIVFLDESGLSQKPPVRRTWAPRAVAVLSDEIEKLHPQLICPCHCTGKAAREYLAGRFPDAFFELRTMPWRRRGPHPRRRE